MIANACMIHAFGIQKYVNLYAFRILAQETPLPIQDNFKTMLERVSCSYMFV